MVNDMFEAKYFRFKDNLSSVASNVNHRFDINTSRETPVGRHFNLPDHSLALLQVTGIECNFRSNIFRKQRESYFIHKMKTLTPNGLNIDSGVFSDLSNI